MSYLDRLRQPSFIPPESGDELFFNLDTLERSGGKKGATQEILDSGESISQDQGNLTTQFTIPAYFTGADYDIETDIFYKALEEKYTQDSPGILKHPRWGNINVFPFTWSQKEELIDGARVGRIDVTFRQVFPKAYPTSDGQSLDDALTNLDSSELISEDISDGIDTDSAQSLANVKAKFTAAVGTIQSTVQETTDQFNAIQSTVTGLIDDVGGNVVETIAGIQRLIRTPARIKKQTLEKINGYKDMVSILIDEFNDDNETLPTNRKNNVIMLQLFAGLAAGTTAEAAAYTDYSIRSEALSAIDTINETLEVFTTGLNDARTEGSVSQEYSGDHNFYSLIFDTITRINEILLNKAFDLKAEKKFTLKNSSDAITLCYEHYKSVSSDTIEFFIQTNRLINDEYTEIPAGREITIYG